MVLLPDPNSDKRKIDNHIRPAGMTGSNEYVFIIIPTSYYPLYTWKADIHNDQLYYDSTVDQKFRDEDAKKAFQVCWL